MHTLLGVLVLCPDMATGLVEGGILRQAELYGVLQEWFVTIAHCWQMT